MEAALVSGLIKAILPKLLSLAEEKYKLHKSVKNGITSLTKELRMIVGAIDDELSEQIEDHRAVPRLSIEELRELAHGIEDCIDSFLYRAAWKQNKSFIRRSIQRGNLKFADEVQRLLKSVEETFQRKQRYTVPGRQHPTTQESPSTSRPLSDPRILDMDLVGMDGPREELLEQLAEVNGPPKQLKVLAIVGFCGLGKTALAAQVYNRATGFERYAWVCAAHRPPAEVLTDMLQKLAAGASSSQGTSDIGQLCVDLRGQLDNKRYFIVIDDIRTEDQWKSIKSALPNNDLASRILITTTIQSLADACSSADGYVHKMSRLDEECSKQLFSKKACPEKYRCYEQPDSTEILKKCDGQPLALVTIGGFLQRNGWPIGPTCEDVCNQLCYHLENDGTLGEMRRVLTRNYTALPGHALKACLLYFGTFPRDHLVRTKRLLRRWLAEGFVEPQSSHTTPDPANYFDVLIDRNIIEPVNVSNNEKVKTCQTYGMMHECILHMAVAQNFVTLFSDDRIEPGYVRRLSLHNSTVINDDNLNSINLSLVRSLTIFGKATEAILDFSKYQLLRVLDLEKCDGLKDDHLKNISSLLLLKYLSLGGNITQLPSDIGKLRDLEVLDLRRTNVNTVPTEVFEIPCLVHLFGQFKLPDKVKPKCEVLDFLSKGKSNLQTLAGFVSDGRQGFLRLIGYLKRLRKLKIWLECSADPDSTDLIDLQGAIQQFVKDRNDPNTGPRSLSLDFDKCSGEFLNFIEGPCYLSSLKLHGNLSALPGFIISLRGLKELCLSSVKLPKGLLEALGKLSYLKYLKLVADELEKIIIKDKEFPRLLRLCFVLQKPTLPTIEKGSMPFLVTLQLFCKDLNDLSDMKIENLSHLKEIILDHRVALDIRDEWKRTAKEHPNRPNVLSAKSDAAERELTVIEDPMALDQDTLERGEAATISKGSVQEIDTPVLVSDGLESSSTTKKQNNCAVQSDSYDKLSLASSIMEISDVGLSTKSSEMADTQDILQEDVVALEVAKIDSVKYSIASDGSVQGVDTQMSGNQESGSTFLPRKQTICALHSSSIGGLNYSFKDITFKDDSSLTVFSGTTNTQETEPMDMDDSITLEHSECLKNTVVLEESIRQTKARTHVKQ